MSLALRKQQLQSVFACILEERMQGVPVINPLLSVNSDYFVHWQNYYLGVLVTPWFMNLMLLPANDETTKRLAALRVGSKETHGFPSGLYEFIVGMETGVGHFLSCSLFSPMFDFKDQAAANETAISVLQELLNVNNQECLDESDDADVSAEANGPIADARCDDQATLQPKSISRRTLLLGGDW